MTDIKTPFSANHWKSLDTDNDHKVSVQELRQHIDSNKDGTLDIAEKAAFVNEAREAGMDTREIKAVLAAHATTEPRTVVFEDKDGWQASKTLQDLAQNDVTSLPYDTKAYIDSDGDATALPSRDTKAVSNVPQGVICLQNQGGHNSCGTTTLSFIMKYFQGHTQENSVTTIDSHIRGTDALHFRFGIPDVSVNTGTSVRNIVKYANENGMRAGFRNNSNLEEIMAMIDKGVPCLCVTDWAFNKDNGGERPSEAEPTGKMLHWVSVVGYQYETNPQTNVPELRVLVANPWGLIQNVSADDFDKIWRGMGKDSMNVNLMDKQVETGYNRAFVALVPRDDKTQVIAPDGSMRLAGEIEMPTDSDGFSGWVAQAANNAVHFAEHFTKEVAQVRDELADDWKKGYDKEGLIGGLKGLINGDSSDMPRLTKEALSGSVEKRAVVIQELMDLGNTRQHHEQAIYDILSGTSWQDFPKLMALLDVKQLASELENDQQAGKVLAWIAKAEVDATGQTGPKFEAFAHYLGKEQREAALDACLSENNFKEGRYIHKVTSQVVRDLVINLMDGYTDGGEESTIYNLFEAISLDQMADVMKGLSMKQVSDELQDDGQLGQVARWTFQSALRTGDWSHVKGILDRMEEWDSYLRADNVIGSALNGFADADLRKIPSDVRSRLIDVTDDITRLRSDGAVWVADTLKGL